MNFEPFGGANGGSSVPRDEMSRPVLNQPTLKEMRTMGLHGTMNNGAKEMDRHKESRKSEYNKLYDDKHVPMKTTCMHKTCLKKVS